MLTFAYGSSMDWQQTRERCPSATFVGIALLPDHRLAFTHRSTKRRCGVADAVPVAGQGVWGVVFEIGDRDVGRLDKSEGFRPGRPREDNSYIREQRHVLLDGDVARPLNVEVYFVARKVDGLRPNQDYKAKMLSGANYWHLPPVYIRDVLEGIEVEA